MTALDIITGALQEINAIAQGETPSPGDAQFALNKLNDLFDEWSARKVFIYSADFPVYQLVSNLSPHTIGPMGVITKTACLAAGVGTYYLPNNYVNGQSVTVAGTANGNVSMNVTGGVQSATSTQFSIAIAGLTVFSAAPDILGTVVPSGETAPTFATPNQGPRPQRVEQATLVLTDQSPNVDVPINIRDDKWWMMNRVKSLTTSIPTDLYYDPTFPNGSLYFWPVPDFSYSVRLKLWTALGNFPNTTYPFSMPQGYQKAVKLSLARDIVGPFQTQWTPQQESNWMRAMKAIETNNIKSPRGNTLDAGMPGGSGHGDFNYFTGDRA